MTFALLFSQILEIVPIQDCNLFVAGVFSTPHITVSYAYSPLCWEDHGTDPARSYVEAHMT